MNAVAEKALQQKMKLTREEQAILDGKIGEAKARRIKIRVAFGNAFRQSRDRKTSKAPRWCRIP